jgi:predicted nucleotidyltransferase component of viral defense system
MNYPKVLIHALETLKGAMEPFFLAGGTALSRYYLHHRESFDLDLFCGPGKMPRRKQLINLWKEAGFKIVHEFDSDPEKSPLKMSRYQIYLNTDYVKIDFVEENVPLLSPPEDFRGILVMGIDDIYYRKILIGIEEGVTGRLKRIAARDVLDLYALNRDHQPLSKRLLLSHIGIKEIQDLHWWLQRFSLRSIADEVRKTGFRSKKPAAQIIRTLQQEMAKATSAILRKNKEL